MIDKEISKTFDRRTTLFIGGFTVITSLLVMRMLQMQLFNYKTYKKKAENNSFRIQYNVPERGKILSVNNSIISTDSPIYRIYIIPEEVKDMDEMLKILTAELSLTKKTIERIKTRIRRQLRFQPVLISENSDWSKLASLQILNLSGLHIKSGFSRKYKLGEAGAQIFGYVGDSKTQSLKAPFFKTGITGLEKSFDDHLTGIPGQNVMITNVQGRITGEDKEQFVPTKSGDNLRLTIDENIQKILFDSLAANKSGCGAVIEIETGNIIAMVSAPSFHPERFQNEDGDEYIATLSNDYTKPFMNKALEGLYPPGSTFKIVVALAALEAGATNEREKVHCPGYWDYFDRRYHCWDASGHNSVNLADALKHSCDIYFYQIALRIGIASIKNMAHKLGLGEKFMDEILPREMAGVIPDRQWKEKRIGYSWLHGDTIISGIGQGFILTNCLQLAVMMARTVSNKKVMPNLIHGKSTGKFEDLGLQKKHIAAVMKGLEQVMRPGGTASGSAINVNGKRMGGKTGTSQVRSISRQERETGILTDKDLKWNQRNHGLFVGYAPLDKPKYAICTITEHSQTSSPAARSAAQTMKELLK